MSKENAVIANNKKGTILRVLGAIGNAVFAVFFTMLVAVFLLFAVGIKPYIVMSGSMEPDILTGSVCFVNTKADYYEIQEGDVISYRSATGSYVTHRAISICAEGIETKGDANEFSDGITTTIENFHGKTLFSVPYVGYALQSMQETKNIAIIFVVIGTLVVFSVIDSVETKKKKKNKRKLQ